MTISGIVAACRPDQLAEATEEVNGLPWAEVHYTHPSGRMVVVIEAADVDQSMDRLKELQGLPRLVMAELAEYCLEEADAREQQA